MPFPTSGVEIIARNASKFIADIGKINSAWAGSSSAIQKLQQRLASARTTQQSYINSLESTARKLANYREQLSQSQKELAKLEAREQAQVAKLNTLTKGTSAYNDQLVLLSNTADKISRKKIGIDITKNTISDLESKGGVDTARLTQANNIVNQLTAALAAAGVGASGFAAAISGVMSAIAPVLAILGILVGVLAVVGKSFIWVGKTAISIAVGAVNLLINAFKGLLSIIGKLLSPLTNFIGRIVTIASGMALYNTVRNAAEGLRELKTEVFEAVTAFQMLEVRFRTIIANDIANRSIIPFSDAVRIANKEVPVLFEWVKKLAVTSPFSVEAIADVLALGTAMGIPIDTSKRLTVAIGNMTAALGLSDEVMWNIVYNLGQMITRGKLTGEEFRDLSRNLFPVYELLDRMGQKTGKTKEEMKALALEGGVAVNDFITEFIALSEEKFPTAMEDLSKTWKVFVTNMHDFLKVFIGLDIFGPIVAKMSAIGAGFFDKLLKSEDLSIITKTLGTGLVKAVEFLTPAMNSLVASVKELLSALGLLPQALGPLTKPATYESFEDLSSGARLAGEGLHVLLVRLLTVVAYVSVISQKIATGISGMAKKMQGGLSGIIGKAATWGANIISAIASGMAKGISAIVSVIKVITSILSYWLKANSPPKVAPEIDRWGNNMMEEFAEGITSATPKIEKSITESVSAAVGNAKKKLKKQFANVKTWYQTEMSKFAGNWSIGDFDIFNDIAGLAEDLIRSIRTNDEDTGLIPAIIGTRENIAKAVEDLRKGLISAENAAKNIGKAVGYASKEFTRFVRAMLNVSVAERDVETASRAVEAAQNRVKEAQEKVNDVTEYYEKILESLQEQLTEVTTEYDEQERLKKIDAALATNLLTVDERRRLENERQSILIKQQIRDVEKQRDVAVEQANMNVKLLEQQEAMYKLQEEAAQSRLENAKAELEASRALIEAQIEHNDLVQEYISLLKSLTEKLTKALGGGGATEGGDEGGGPPLTSGLRIPAIEIDWEKWWDEAMGNAETGIGKFLAEFDPLKDLFADGGAITELKSALAGLGDVVGGLVPNMSFMDWLGKMGDVANNVMGVLFGSGGAPAGTGGTDEELSGSGGRYKTSGSGVGGLFGQIELFAKRIPGWIAIFAPLEAPIKAISIAIDSFAISLGILFTGGKTTQFSDFLKAIAESATSKLSILALGVIELAVAVEKIAAAYALAKDALEKIGNFIDDMKEWSSSNLDKKSPAAFIAGLVASFLLLSPSIIPIIATFVTEAIDEFAKLAVEVVTHSIVPDMMQDILDIITTKLDETIDVISTKLGEVKTKFATFQTDMFKTWDKHWIDVKIKVTDLFDSNKPDSIVMQIKKSLDILTEKFKTFGEDTIGAFIEHWDDLTASIKLALQNLNRFLRVSATGVAEPEKAGAKPRPGVQTGGNVWKNVPTIVGEARPEVFIPRSNGVILPNISTFMNRMSTGMYGNMMASAMPVMNVNNIDNSVHITVDANYRNTQSSAGIYYDISAALAASRL